MSQLYEYLNEGEDNYESFYGVNWAAQTFTPQVAHKITSVKLLLYRSGAPGTITVSIRATDGSGHPTEEDLCSGTTDGNTLGTGSEGTWREITLGAGYNLDQSVKYAIVMRAPSGNASNRATARADASSPPYADGNMERSSNSGSSWSTLSGWDLLFEDWGEPILEIPSVQTNDADNITHEEAKLHGTLTDDGGEACQVRFQYGETIGYGTDTEWQDGKVSSDPFEQLIENLDPDQTYHFRAQAKNSAGTGSGSDKEFSTLETPPEVGELAKIIITHPALKTIRVLVSGVDKTKYDYLSNPEQGYIESGLEIPVPTPCHVEVTTLADQTWTFFIPSTG